MPTNRPSCVSTAADWLFGPAQTDRSRFTLRTSQALLGGGSPLMLGVRKRPAALAYFPNFSAIRPSQLAVKLDRRTFEIDSVWTARALG